MIWLVLGVLLWAGAHLFKRILPKQRAALGNWGKPLVAVTVAVSVGLMIVGYREGDHAPLYVLAAWTWHLNNLLMLVAVFLMGVGNVKGVVRTHIRHPILLGMTIWSVAHLLVNGDVFAIVLFGGLGAWALLEIVAINCAEGHWQAPARGTIGRDAIVAAVAVVLFALIVAIHGWLGHPAFIRF